MNYQDIMYQIAQNRERIQHIQDTTLKDILENQNRLIYLSLESAKDTPKRLDSIECNLDKVLNYYDEKKQDELRKEGAKEFITGWVKRIKTIGGIILLVASVLSVGWGVFSFLILAVEG